MRIYENKVYLFSNGIVKMANKKFTSIKNDFCIVFEKLGCNLYDFLQLNNFKGFPIDYI